MLIVAVLVSFLGLVLYTTFYQGTALWQKARVERGEFKDAFFSERLAADLRNMIPLGQLRASGEETKFEFYTLLPGRELGQKGDTAALLFPCRVRYVFDAQAKKVLREVESYSQILMPVSGARQSKSVLENVRDFRLNYYGRAENPALDWRKRWDKDCLPNAVKLSVEYADSKRPFVRVLEVPGGGCRSLTIEAA